MAVWRYTLPTPFRVPRHEAGHVAVPERSIVGIDSALGDSQRAAPGDLIMAQLSSAMRRPHQPQLRPSSLRPKFPGILGSNRSQVIEPDRKIPAREAIYVPM